MAVSREVKDLQNRLDDLLERWLTATPAERAQLVLEKMRLEEALEAAKRRAKAS